MSEYLVKSESLTAIADAVRNKVGTTASLSLDAMAITIDSMVIKTTTTINIVPDTTDSFTYDGSVKTPVWRNYDPEQLTISGNTSATNAGTYKVYFTPKADYEWSDGTVEPREVQWTIGRKAISVPSQSGTLTYTGSSLSPSWSNYNNSQITISGTTSGTNAGSYTATFTPNSNHKWSDGTTAAKSVTWSIAKAAGSLSLSATSATVIGKNSTQTFTATRSGDGKISVSSSNTSIATVSLSGTTVTITSKGYGTATITVSVAAGTNYKAPSNKTYVVTVDYRYLYNSGTEYTSFTGALTAAARALDDYESGRTKAPTITKGGSSLTIAQGSSSYGYNAGWAYWANPINLSNYTTLRISGSTGGGSSPKGVGIWSSTSGSIQGSSMVACIDSFASGTHTIDVSSLNGSYYIGFYVYRKDRYVTCNYLRLE